MEYNVILTAFFHQYWRKWTWWKLAINLSSDNISVIAGDTSFKNDQSLNLFLGLEDLSIRMYLYLCVTWSISNQRYHHNFLYDHVLTYVFRVSDELKIRQRPCSVFVINSSKFCIRQFTTWFLRAHVCKIEKIETRVELNSLGLLQRRTLIDNWSSLSSHL